MLLELPSFEMLGNYSSNGTVSQHRRLEPLSVSIMEIRPMILVFTNKTGSNIWSGNMDDDEEG